MAPLTPRPGAQVAADGLGHRTADATHLLRTSAIALDLDVPIMRVVTRAQLAYRLAELVGPETLTITAAGSGWPAQGQLHVDGQVLPVDLFVGPITLAYRENRRDIERRFQNPGQGRAVIPTPGRLPLLIGIWDTDADVYVERPVIAVADPTLRVDRTTTRFSVFQHLPSLIEAMHTGWVEHVNSAGERLLYLLPPLLPMAVTADAAGLDISTSIVQAVVLGSGLADDDDGDAGERARRATNVVVRDARFAKQVVDAYGGMCAMCGLDAGLVEGAHIYPAAAQGSPDKPWNGLALCPTHHSTFDRHLVGVRLADHAIVYRSTLMDQVSTNAAAAAFVNATYPSLALPSDEKLRPRQDMFVRRYEHFAGEYDWLIA